MVRTACMVRLPVPEGKDKPQWTGREDLTENRHGSQTLPCFDATEKGHLSRRVRCVIISAVCSPTPRVRAWVLPLGGESTRK